MKKLIFLLAIAVLLIVYIERTGVGVKANMSGNHISGPNARLQTAIMANDRTAITQALASGADVNSRGPNGVTPLMRAVDHLKQEAVTELLARGANPNDKAADGNSAVTLAVANYRQAPEIFFAVMKSGGDPNTRRPDNDPVIIRFVNDCNCEYIRHMKSFGADLDITTREDDPIITDAGLTGDWDVVWCLIELGAKYDYEGTAREPLSLSIAAQFPSSDSPIFPYKRKVWEFLRAHGVKVKELNG